MKLDFDPEKLCVLLCAPVRWVVRWRYAHSFSDSAIFVLSRSFSISFLISSRNFVTIEQFNKLKMSEEVFTEGGRLLKMEVDYSGTVDEKIPACEKLAKVIDTKFQRVF